MSDEPAFKGLDPDYLARREAQERAAAEHAPDPAARKAHQLLAARYAEQREQATATTP